jgi:hypothetical protein
LFENRGIRKKGCAVARRLGRAFLIASYLLAADARTDVDAAGPFRLDSAIDQRKIMAELQKSEEFRKIGGKKTEISTITRYPGQPGVKGHDHDLVKILIFRYDDGKTIRVTWDETARAPKKIEILTAYPTPPSEREQNQAKELARSKSAAVRALLAKTENKVEITFLPAVDTRRPRNRLITVFFTPAKSGVGVLPVTVNLSDGTVKEH